APANHDPPEPPGLLMVPVVPQLRPDAALRELFDLTHLSSPRASLNLSLLRLFRARSRSLPELRQPASALRGRGNGEGGKKVCRAFPHRPRGAPGPRRGAPAGPVPT